MGVVAALIVGLQVYAMLPVHPVEAHCYDFRVYFEGPKSERLNALYIKWIEEKGQPYFIRSGRISSRTSSKNGTA